MEVVRVWDADLQCDARLVWGMSLGPWGMRAGSTARPDANLHGFLSRDRAIRCACASRPLSCTRNYLRARESA